MQLIHKALITLAGTALLGAGLPALAQQQAPRPVYNTPGGGGSSSPYDFGAARKSAALDPLVEQQKKFNELSKVLNYEAYEKRKATEIQLLQNEQNNTALLARKEQEYAAMVQRHYARAQPASAPSGTAAQSGTEKQNVKMIYKKPEDKKKEPGRIFNLKWR